MNRPIHVIQLRRSLTGEVVGPNWTGIVQQPVMLFVELNSDCAIKYTKTVKDKNGNVTVKHRVTKHNPVRKEASSDRSRVAITVNKNDAGHRIVESAVAGSSTNIKTVYRCDPDVCTEGGNRCEGAAVINDPDNDGLANGTLHCDCPE